MNAAARLLLSALLLISTSVFAQVRSATIYLVPWELSTFVALDEKDVKRLASVKTEILEEHIAQSLFDWLNRENYQNPPIPPVKELRLVIDFTLKDGSIESCHANYFNLIEVKSGRVRKINEIFRSRFSSFL